MKWPWTKTKEAPVAEAAPSEPMVPLSEVRAMVATAARQASEDAQAQIADQLRLMMPKSPLGDTGMTPASSAYGIYAYNRPMNYTTPQDPLRRPGSYVDLDTLRRLADTYDVLRACIQHLKREVISVPIEVVARDSSDKSNETKARIKEATAFFSTRGGIGGAGRMRGEFEGMVIEDLSVIGSTAIYYAPTLGGTPYEILAIDAATIRPRVDGYGFPGPGEEIWEQWVYGVKTAGYTANEMLCTGLPTNARSWTPYFASPVEWLIFTVRTALKSDGWNSSWLTDGNIPDELISVPESWNPTQIKEYAEYFDAMLAGNSGDRHKAKLVPGGMSRLSHSRKDQDFKEFDLWLLRRTCAIMGVQPASVGFAGEQYKVSQEDSMQSTSQFGAGIILMFRKDLYDDLLERQGFGDLETRNVSGVEEKTTERASRNVSLVGGGIKTPNEARADEGLEAIEGGDTLLVPNTLTPLERALEPPEPVPVPTNGVPPDDKTKQERAALAQWERKALNRLKASKGANAPFASHVIAPEKSAFITDRLARCETADDVREVFAAVDHHMTIGSTDWAERIRSEILALSEHQ